MYIFLISSSVLFIKYLGAISAIVLAPNCPSWYKAYAALAYASNTLAVKSGLDSSFKLYSMI